MTLEPWQLITFGVGTALSFVGGGWAVGKVLAGQYDRLLTERETARDKSSATRNAEINARFDRIEQAQEADAEKLQAIITTEVNELCQSRDRLGDRVGQVERELAAVPTKEDVDRIHQRIDQVAQDIAGLGGQFNSAINTLNLIHRKLLGSHT
ncbi:hypothetical protein [Chitinimonas sp.]|uniref:hypothetical protein n=1 Tax=Chitinimonas sp. TaxID=1934313 RepID=UPI0035AE570F